ncbi:hypothetical protein [Acidovorax kalamii]|uniref:hypothetical protein n=1 Tax=Acidovorax kalamii TaxID=2004485 RepID=UPI0020910B48|nr:hypothetical protein [Acidovorax kalamii]MCO5358708.1 hypothetical protein [Acidovorax kalamii]
MKKAKGHSTSSGVIKASAVVLLIGLLSACGQSLDSALMEVGRCYKAGNHLQDETLRLAAGAEMERLLAQKRDAFKGSTVSATMHYFAPINEQLNHEIFPQGRSTPLDHSLKLLRKWQQSSYCQGLIEKSLRVK